MNRKTTLLIFICVFTFSPVFGQADLYYWAYKTKYKISADSLETVLIPKDESFRIGNLLAKVEYESYSRIANRNEVLLKLSDKSILEKQLSEEFDILPVFRHGNFPLIPTGEIVLHPKENVDYDQIQAFCDGKITLLKKSKYGTLTVKPKNIKELIKLSNQIYESGLVEWCEPNFLIEIITHQTVTPTDPLYPQQYYLNQTNNIDINAPQAWGLSRGLNEVRVAVIDDGVESHEDLNGRVLAGFTPLDANGQGAPTNNPPPEVEHVVGHGQACAGIIGATHDNDGISGVFPCAQIVPVNIFNSWRLDYDFPVGYRLRWLETPEDIAEAINWAWDEGNAEILSNSWGYRTANPNNIPESGQIIQAIENARTQGREGLGSIVVFSSGNFNQVFNGVAFPANVDGVVTVGAIDQNGNIWNYSSRGAEMDLVAPSGNAGGTGDVVTTDRMGANGYDSGNYTNNFGGTSAAAPQVSGVAALMLSANPNLTEQQVVNILNNTATDMGPNGFDNTFGHGRLNAEAAVEGALPDILGSATLCTSENYSVPVTGANVQWSASPSNMVNISNNGNNTITVTPSGNSNQGEFTLTATISSSGCGSIEVSKDVRFDGIYTLNSDGTKNYMGRSYSYPASYNTRSITVFSDAPGTTYTWDMFPQDIQWTGNHNRATFFINYPGSYVLTCTAVSYCGESKLFFIINIDDNYQYNYTIYPNPTSETLNIKATEKPIESGSQNLTVGTASKSLLAQTITEMAELYDFNGIFVKGIELDPNGVTSLDVSNLKEGMYFLKILRHGKEEVHQVMVNH